MKTFICLLFAICLGSAYPSLAQQYVFDPKYFASVMSNQAVRSGAEATHAQYLDRIQGNIENLNTNMGTVVLAQHMIYNSLANVNSALKNGLEVKYMVTLISDISHYLDECLQLARGQPYLLLFATDMAAEMRTRALAMSSEVAQFILKPGDNILADYNGRDDLLRKVTATLQIIDGLAYGAWRAMFWAKERGLLASINPFSNFINQDKAFVSQVLLRAKYLQP